MLAVRSNFSLWLEENGVRVPGSFRKGHNVFTDVGREWIKRLCVHSPIGDLAAVDDVPLDDRRFRWIGVGTGSLLELTSVSGLAVPLTITTGPAAYIRELPAPAYIGSAAIRYSVAFTGASADFDHHGASVTVSEAGLFVDVNTGGGPGLDSSLGTHQPVTYKSFDPVTKLAAQTLTITWEFRF